MQVKRNDICNVKSFEQSHGFYYNIQYDMRIVYCMAHEMSLQTVLVHSQVSAHYCEITSYLRRKKKKAVHINFKTKSAVESINDGIGT